MGLHLLLGFCKLYGGTTPFLATMAWPFFLKLSRIIVSRDDEGGRRSRWDRIIQLLNQQLPNTGHSITFSNNEPSLQALSFAVF